MALELEQLCSGYNLRQINDNFQRIENFLNDDVVKREIVEGVDDNEMRTNLDMNQFMIVNTSRVISAETLDLALQILEDMGYDTTT
jgi:hypothetical protein